MQAAKKKPTIELASGAGAGVCEPIRSAFFEISLTTAAAIVRSLKDQSTSKAFHVSPPLKSPERVGQKTPGTSCQLEAPLLPGNHGDIGALRSHLFPPLRRHASPEIAFPQVQRVI